MPQNYDNIPNKTKFYRAMEIVPGFLTWSIIVLPFVLSVIEPVWVAYFIIAFDLYWLIKSLRLSTNLIRGYRRMYRLNLVDWRGRLKDLADLNQAITRAEQRLQQLAFPWWKRPEAWWNAAARNRRREQINLHEHLSLLKELAARPQTLLNPSLLWQAVIIAEYNEPEAVLINTIESVLATDYDPKKVIVVLAYEERGSDEDKAMVKRLVEQYQGKFADFKAYMHPADIAGEVKGKGGNITYAARQLLKYTNDQRIEPENVIVTTLDADNHPSPNYFSYLSYIYATDPNRIHKSYQPIPMFYNNIWDASAPVRVIVTGTAFWTLMQAMRPHLLRNFSAHAQGLQTLIDTDFWSVHTIVEDGHQYWRTFFAYDGDHQVVPLFTPNFQDAVMEESYPKTLRAQYVQLRRWAWGVTDFPYAMTNAVKYKTISWGRKSIELIRLLEGHISWATAPLLLTLVAWLPLYLNHRFSQTLLAHQLPVIAGRILAFATVGILVTIFISLISLPPRPERYSPVKSLGMLLQWILMPFVTIIFSAFPAIDSQTRLMLGKYLEWRVTKKRVIT